jgi:transposase
MRTRVIAVMELVLIFPAVLFMTALVLRNFQPLQYEPARSAQQLVMWYAGRMWTLWFLLLGLPLIVLEAKRVKKQKFDREDARLLLRLMRENNFPQNLGTGSENRDLRQLLWHRHRLVQMRTRIMNQLQALAMNEGYRWKKKLFSEQGRALLEKLR